MEGFSVLSHPYRLKVLDNLSAAYFFDKFRKFRGPFLRVKDRYVFSDYFFCPIPIHLFSAFVPGEENTVHFRTGNRVL